MKPDPGLEPIREVRKAISRSFGNDPARLVAYYIEMQKRFADRLQRAPEQTLDDEEEDAAEQGVAPDPHPGHTSGT